MNTLKIKSFMDLIAWQEGHKLVLGVYKITKIFPKEEIFVLVSQIRRSAVSVTSNIAEGFSRNNKKEKNQFYNYFLGSSMELLIQLIIAKDLNYISVKEFDLLTNKLFIVQKLISGLMKTSVNYQNTKY